MSITLRENQISPVQVCVDFFKEKNPCPSIAVMPTAWGKSILVAKVTETINDGAVVINPSKELLEQNYSKYVMTGARATIYSASFGSKRLSNCVFATIGSIKNIGSRFKEMGIKKMIIDEIHLFPRESDSMLGKFLKESEITHVLGITASPLKLQSNMDAYGNPFSKLVMLTSRSKKGNFFKEIISMSQIQEMIKLGFWSRLEYEQYDIDTSGLKFNSTKADYTEESLKKVYESNDTEAKIIQKCADLKDRKSIVVFVPSIADAIALSKRIPQSAAVYSGMKPNDRDRIVRGFKNGGIRVLVNVSIVAVGFDHPGIDCVIGARPTASLTWLYQALGRGTRIQEFKKDCLIVDFAGNIKKFGRIEYLHFVKEGSIWKLYGEGDNLLSGIPLHEIGKWKKPGAISQDATVNGKEFIMEFGKHSGKPLSQIPKDYLQWMKENFNWTEARNQKLKEVLFKV